MKNELLSVAEAAERITAGDVLAIAGDEALLAQLPKGNWIGGTSVYFVTDTGGATIRDRVFCTTLTDAAAATPRHVPAADLATIADGYQPGGYSVVLIPAFSSAHSAFAIDGQSYPGLFNQPLVGWIAGVHVDEIGSKAPKVFDGATGLAHDDGAVVLHVTLDSGKSVNVDIVNIFSRADTGTTFVFEDTGFEATTAKVNGETVNLAQYITDNTLDTRLPLVANYAGALVNVSVQAVDTDTGKVAFYAPVMAGVEYRQASALDNYAAAFADKTANAAENQYSCNCILNYLHGELEGKTTGAFTGPITFGEIAYILLNQTLVRLDVKAA
ncbi:DUF6976 family protein [Pseudoprimorskyibacter insulae]|uniref:Uncharacterized protein n=1 Tax=Pseudoprimorskyibacter insulae TaxID=1695997 RepID=A0A2R8AZI5_9RHOB|nr:hypothetical protein [Pseudoprimorskyibacter insulae]SPF81249.1 hypothetical protein PRI8871_03071 [Pseudoprimorskyibacter insulae]